MTPSSQRVLVVANRTAATPRLLEEVARRTSAGTCEFLLLLPTTPRKRQDWTSDDALRLLRRAAPQAHIRIVDPQPDAVAAIERTIAAETVDEIIVSTASARVTGWLKRDLAHRVKGLGLPVAIIPPETDRRMTWDEVAQRAPSAWGG